MDRGSGTSPVRGMGRREVDSLPIGLVSFRAVMIPGRVVMFVVIAIRQHLLTFTRIERGREDVHGMNVILFQSLHQPR
jgi:hypothetical protein